MGLLFKEIFFGDDEIVRNQQGSLLFGSAGQVVEADIGLLVRQFFFHLVLVECIQLLQALVCIGVHGAELQEVEYLVVAAHTLGLVNHSSLAFHADGYGCRDEYGRQHNQYGNGKKDVEYALPHRQVEGVEYLTV